VPNQEKVINQDKRVTYRDNSRKLPMILLPNREPMQVNSVPFKRNFFRNYRKQEWNRGKFKTEQFSNQNGLPALLGDLLVGRA
jgi:hypothetical protein